MAEHSYFVALWATRLPDLIGWHSDSPNHRVGLILNFVKLALEHDLDEVFTGDVPSPFKKLYNHDLATFYLHENDRTPTLDELAMLRFLDLLEAAVFLREEIKLGNNQDLLVETRKEILMKLSDAWFALPWPSVDAPARTTQHEVWHKEISPHV